jgi:uncharacterized protein
MINLAWTRNAALALIAAIAVGAAFDVHAQAMKFFRIGTGGTAGTYFPIGGLIANAISNPPGSRPCHDGGSCGVPGLVAIALATNGAVANIEGIQKGEIEAGLTQSDVAHWAYEGTGVFQGKPRVTELRAIANLYPETFHVVARKGAGIAAIRDLKGKRVAFDEPGSGGLIDARIVLQAYGVDEHDLVVSYMKPDVAGTQLRAGSLDAFFFIGGSPVTAIAELSSSVGIDLVSLEGPEAEKVLQEHKYFAGDKIAAGTYSGVDYEAKTLSVNALLVTSDKQPEDLIYAVTKALWNNNTRKLLDNGHAKGKMVRPETAPSGLGLPLHPGAERFYREVGLLPKG